MQIGQRFLVGMRVPGKMPKNYRETQADDNLRNYSISGVVNRVSNAQA